MVLNCTISGFVVLKAKLEGVWAREGWRRVMRRRERVTNGLSCMIDHWVNWRRDVRL